MGKFDLPFAELEALLPDYEFDGYLKGVTIQAVAVGNLDVACDALTILVDRDKLGYEVTEVKDENVLASGEEVSLEDEAIKDAVRKSRQDAVDAFLRYHATNRQYDLDYDYVDYVKYI
jgi:hypothetical protein